MVCQNLKALQISGVFVQTGCVVPALAMVRMRGIQKVLLPKQFICLV